MAQGGSLKRQMSMDDLASELQCPVCLELYKQPIVLPCSHVLCRSPCAERLFTNNFIRCPICRENCYIAGGAESLPRVLTLENIIQRYNAETSIDDDDDDEREHTTDHGFAALRSRDVPCQLCHGNPRKAVKSCVDCNASYCSACLELSHPDREPFSNHTLIEPKRHPRPKEAKCSLHGEPCSMYCETCRLLACMQCLLVDGHVGHSTEAIEIAYKRVKKQLADNIHRLENSQKLILTDTLKSTEGVFEQVKDIVSCKRVRVNEQCDSLIAAVESKRRYFLSDLDHEELERGTATRVRVDGLKKKLGDCESLSHYASEILQETDHISFLQLASGINHRIMRQTSFQGEPDESPDVTINSLPSLHKKVVDLRKELSFLSCMNYLSAPSTPPMPHVYVNFTSALIIVTPNDADLINGYRVFCSEGNTGTGLEEAAFHEVEVDSVTTGSHFPGSRQGGEETAILIDDLRLNATYACGLSAFNDAGSSDYTHCRSIIKLASPGEIDLPIPEISESQCRTFTSAIHIYSPTTAVHHDHITYFLLHRKASGNKTWQRRQLYTRSEHRVFGLRHNTTYEFTIWADNGNGQGVKSSHVFLTTGSVRESSASPLLSANVEMVS